MATYIRTESTVDPSIFLESPYTEEGVLAHAAKIAQVQADHPDDVRYFVGREYLVEREV
jgi:hypothetical protein